MNEELLYAAVDSVIAERHRQHKKWGEQRHTPEYWLVILMEEIGEFAQALQRERGQGKDSDQSNKLEESIHFTAVSLAIVEQLIEEMEFMATAEGVADIDEQIPEGLAQFEYTETDADEPSTEETTRPREGTGAEETDT